MCIYGPYDCISGKVRVVVFAVVATVASLRIDPDLRISTSRPPMGNSFSVRGETELGSPKHVDGAREHSRLPASCIRVGVANATNHLVWVLPCLCSANHIHG